MFENNMHKRRFWMKKEKQINQNSEQKIISVATEMFANNGFDGTSIRDICKKADVNISMISYYFGGKEELYAKIVSGIVEKIITYMKHNMHIDELMPKFDKISKADKINFLYTALDFIIEYFYSDKISDSELMLLFREQMNSGILINAEGYKLLKRLLASILNKDENDKEIIFRTVTIVGQVQSAKIFKQFSLNLMGQSKYTQQDTLLFKSIVISQIKAILAELDKEST